jgi:hypothetical protein
MSEPDVIEWHPPRGPWQPVARAFLRGTLRASAFSFLVGALYILACRRFAPGLELSALQVFATILGVSAFFIAMGASVIWMPRDPHRVGQRGVCLFVPRRRGWLPWSKVARFNVDAQRTILVQPRRGRLMLAELPEGASADAIVRTFREHAIEDSTLSWKRPSLPPGLLKSPAADALVYGGMLLGGPLLGVANVWLGRAAWRGSRVAPADVGATLTIIELIVGPGLALGLFLWRRGCEGRIAATAGAVLNIGALGVAKLVSILWISASLAHASR